MGEMISAYYQCYKRDKCVDFVLNNYRFFYPIETIVLICDGGNDYSKIAEKYNCEYFYEQKINTKDNLIFNDKNSAFLFIKRLINKIHLIKTKYFIILEDDVYIKNKINESDLKYEINGCNYNEFLNKNIQYILNEKTDKFHYGGCGGSVLDTDFFKYIFENPITVQNDVYEYCELSPKQEWASDRILSYLCLKYNGTIGQYSGFCEAWYPNLNERLTKNSIQVLHQYKNLY